MDPRLHHAARARGGGGDRRARIRQHAPAKLDQEATVISSALETFELVVYIALGIAVVSSIVAVWAVWWRR
jgi:hypothetical protein